MLDSLLEKVLTNQEYAKIIVLGLLGSLKHNSATGRLYYISGSWMQSFLSDDVKERLKKLKLGVLCFNTDPVIKASALQLATYLLKVIYPSYH